MHRHLPLPEPGRRPRGLPAALQPARWRRAAAAALWGAAIGSSGAASGAAASGATGTVPPAPVACPALPAQVMGAIPGDLADLCAGAGDALRFLAGQGLQPRMPVVLEVVSRLPAEVGPGAAGCYFEQRRRIYVLPYDGFRGHRTWFAVPIDRSLYRALAAHETAHAVAADHFRIVSPSIQAREYIAYVTMLSTMEQGMLERVLRTAPDTAVLPTEHLNALVYLFDPMRFGIGAWRHYRLPENGPAFLRAVLAGEALTD